MSVESKIREMMNGGKPASTAPETLDEATLGADSVQKDQSIKAANDGDRNTKPRQGSSADASYEERESEEENQGAVASKSTPTSPRPQTSGPGAAPNFKTVGDPTSVVNMPGSAGNVAQESIDIDAQLTAILGEDASEEFRTKTASLFEAVVVARVNAEMDKLVEALEQKAEQQITEAKEEMTNKVDAYLSYVVEQWIKDNQVAVDTGLRTEIAEDFISGLKTLFVEHYIDVPEEKYDVLGEMESTATDLEAKLNEAIADNIELAQEVVGLKKAVILENLSRGLADTETEKLQKLVEGVEFESDALFEEKVAAIKETYFPKNAKTSSADQLTEDMTGSASFEPDTSDSMAQYVRAISLGAKNR